jgi:hypothetical protein
MSKVSVLVVACLAACSVEEAAQQSQTSSALTQLGEPMFVEITAAQNPQQPPGRLRGFIHSVNTFDAGFTTGGQFWPYTMVGTVPQLGGSTVVATQVVPTRFHFADGTVLDANGSVKPTLDSPVFGSASYSVGKTQFGDAVQRATFWSSMNSNYHVLLGKPVVRPTWDLYVPADKAFVVGGFAAGVDIDWFYNQVRTQLSPGWQVTTFPIVLSHNVVFYIGEPTQCCVLGFHDAYLAGLNPVYNKFDAQTWTWASYLDPGLFPPGIEDVHALSHEVSEWINDPFGFNLVPPWQGNDAYGCSPVLEVGDPIVGSAYPITMNGRTYHPQNEVMLPWFARESPSSAYAGAYTYPDTSVLTTLPNDCSL